VARSDEVEAHQVLASLDAAGPLDGS